MSDMKTPNMSDQDLDIRLAAYDAPEPSALLKARILKAAKDMPQLAGPEVTKTRLKPLFAKRYMAIAASLVVISAAGLATLNMSAPINDSVAEMAELQEDAAALGFEDIYNWVESPDISG